MFGSYWPDYINYPTLDVSVTLKKPETWLASFSDQRKQQRDTRIVFNFYGRIRFNFNFFKFKESSTRLEP